MGYSILLNNKTNARKAEKLNQRENLLTKNIEQMQATQHLFYSNQQRIQLIQTTTLAISKRKP